VDYDFLSVMHYDKTAFAADPKDVTMVTKDPKYQVSEDNRLAPHVFQNVGHFFCKILAIFFKTINFSLSNRLC